MGKTKSINVRITGDPSALQKALRRSAADAQGFAGKLKGLERGVASFAAKSVKASAMVAGGGMALITGAVIKTGFAYNDLKQRSEIAFTTMLGSGKKAQVFVKQLADFAAKTPFEFEGLTMASQRLMAMGFASKDVLPTMDALGDAVAALGGSGETLDRVVTALGQIKAKGKASAEEMMQITEAGIPAWQMLADKIGTSVPQAMKLVEKGAVDADTVIKSVVEGSNARFDGMMAKQSKTFSGLLSTLKDTFAQVSGQVMEPFFKMAVKGMQWLADFTAKPEFTAGVKHFGEILSRYAHRALEAFVAFFRKNWDGIKQGLKQAADLARNLGHFFADVVWPAARKVNSTLGGLKNTVATLAGAYVGLRAGIVANTVAMKLMGIAGVTSIKGIKGALISTGIGLAFIALGLAATYVITHWDKVKVWFGKTVRYLSLLWGGFKDLFIGGAKMMAGSLLTVMTGSIRGVLEAMSRLPGPMGKPFKKALKGLRSFTTDWIEDGKKQMEEGGAAMGSAWGDAFKEKVITAQEEALDIKAHGRGQEASGAATAGASGATGKAGAIIGDAVKYGPDSGITYTWGGASPETGFDCSGFLFYLYKKHGITIPRTSDTQYFDPNAIPVKRGQEKPGDGVYFVGSNSGQNKGRPPRHCGIYIGGGKFIEYYSKGKPAKIGELSSRGDYMGARRWIKVKASSGGASKPSTGGAGGKPPQVKVTPITTAEAKEFISLPQSLATQLLEAQVLTPKNTADDMRVLKKIRAHLMKLLKSSNLTAEERAQVLSELKGVNDDIRSIQDAHQDKLKTKREKALEAQRKHLDKLKAVLEKQVGIFQTAYAKVEDRVLRTYDAVTEKGLSAIASKFAGDTPAEAELKRMAAERESARAAKELQDAQKELAEAAAAGDPDRIRAAQEAIADIEYNAKVSSLEARADLERAAREKAQADEEAEYRSKREEDRVRLQTWLNDQMKALSEGKLTWQQFYNNIFKVLPGQFETPIADMGTLLGEAFRDAFLEALGEAKDAWKGVNKAQDAVKGGTGGSGSGSTGGAVAASFEWGGQKWTPNELAAFRKWLSNHGTSYKTWAGNHAATAKKMGWPMLAEGGIATGPTFALIGEKGPEAVVPLDRFPGGGTKSSELHVHFDGPVYADERGIRELVEKVHRELLRKQSRNGSLGLA